MRIKGIQKIMRKLILILLLIAPFVGSGQVPFMMVEEGESLVLVASIDDGNTYEDVTSDGTYIYAARSDSGITAYQLSGGSLSVMGRLDRGDATAQGLYCDGTYIYAAYGFDGIRVYSFDGSTFTQQDSEDPTLTFFEEVWLGDFYFYSAETQNNNIYRYSISAPNLTQENTVSIQGNQLYDIYSDGEYVVEGSDTYTALYDTSLSLVASNTNAGGNHPGVGNQNDTIFFAGADYEVFHESTGSLIEDTSITINEGHDVFIEGNYVYMSSNDSLFLHNKTTYQKYLSTAINDGRGLWYDGNYIYVADGTAGLKVYEIK